MPVFTLLKGSVLALLLALFHFIDPFKKLDKPFKWIYASAGFLKPAEAYIQVTIYQSSPILRLDNTVSSPYAPIGAYGEDTVNITKPPTQVPMDRWEVFLRTLGDRVSAASEKNLTARCWKLSTLRREIRAITKSNQAVLRTTFPPAHVVIEQLKRMGLIHSIKVQSPNDAELNDFLLLDMEAGKGEPIYPLELLQAYLPDGVVCYFSAINYYELTTQVVAHHHVARLNPPRAKK